MDSAINARVRSNIFFFHNKSGYQRKEEKKIWGSGLVSSAGLPECRDSCPSQILRYLNQHRLIGLSRVDAVIICFK